MFKFGKSSKLNLRGVDEDIVEVLDQAIKYIDLTIIEGVRSKERQQELYDQKKTKTLQSKHLEGKAVDVAPYHNGIDWEDRENFIYMGGIIMGIAYSLGIPLRWGGDWNKNNDLSDNNFDDLVHFELDY